MTWDARPSPVPRVAVCLVRCKHCPLPQGAGRSDVNYQSSTGPRINQSPAPDVASADPVPARFAAKWPVYVLMCSGLVCDLALCLRAQSNLPNRSGESKVKEKSPVVISYDIS